MYGCIKVANASVEVPSEISITWPVGGSQADSRSQDRVATGQVMLIFEGIFIDALA